MKIPKFIFLLLTLFSLALNNCRNEQVDATNDGIQLEDCDIPKGLLEYKKFENQESTIKKLDYDYNGIKSTFYHIGLLRDVPTGYLAACNLPEDFKQDGLKIRFSGTVYVPKNVDLMNLTAVTVKLTKLEKITDNPK